MWFVWPGDVGHASRQELQKRKEKKKLCLLASSQVVPGCPGFEAASGFFGLERRMLHDDSAASTSCTCLDAEKRKLYLCRC